MSLIRTCEITAMDRSSVFKTTDIVENIEWTVFEWDTETDKFYPIESGIVNFPPQMRINAALGLNTTFQSWESLTEEYIYENWIKPHIQNQDFVFVPGDNNLARLAEINFYLRQQIIQKQQALLNLE